MIGYDELYSWVKHLPIVDWHNHLDLTMMAEDNPLGTLYETWVKTDPYKHRAMRICGEPEEIITGDATEEEKWAAWTRTLPKLVGNPLFAWAEQELAFLNERLELTGDERLSIRHLPNMLLSRLSPMKLLKAFDVEYYDPGYRMNAGNEVDVYELDKVHRRGGRVLDISVDDVTLLKSPGMRDAARYAVAHGWMMILHLGALRETSDRLRVLAGPFGGYAGMRQPVDPMVVADFLNRLELGGILPRTVLLTLNPEAHAQLAVLSGSYCETGVPGKVQLGPAWWWVDHEEGIRDILEKNAAYGVLSTFIGMTTDSRSLLSFVRHDYFRRILCKWTAEKIAAGIFPDDESLVRPMLERVCFLNAATAVRGTKYERPK